MLILQEYFFFDFTFSIHKQQRRKRGGLISAESFCNQKDKNCKNTDCKKNRLYQKQADNIPPGSFFHGRHNFIRDIINLDQQVGKHACQDASAGNLVCFHMHTCTTFFSERRTEAARLPSQHYSITTPSILSFFCFTTSTNSPSVFVNFSL